MAPERLGRIVKMDDQMIPRMDLDQVHLPDPISADIQNLQEENLRMREEIRAMEKNMKCLRKDKKELIKEIEKMEFIESSREE